MVFNFISVMSWWLVYGSMLSWSFVMECIAQHSSQITSFLQNDLLKQRLFLREDWILCYGRPLLHAWLHSDLKTIPNNRVRENSLKLSSYGVGLSSGQSRFESGLDPLFLPCIWSFVSLLTLSNTSPGFLRVCSTRLFKTLLEKEKLLTMSNFYFSHSVFYLSEELSTTFIRCEIVMWKLF